MSRKAVVRRCIVWLGNWYSQVQCGDGYVMICIGAVK